MPGYSPTGALALSGRTFPALVVTCTTCGFMAPINAVKAGLHPVDNAKEVETSESASPPAGEAS